MRERPRFVSFFLAVLFLAGALAPLAAYLAQADEPASGCTCLIKMDCCLKGLCHMGEGSAAGSLRWAACSGARREEKVPPMTGLMAVCESRVEVTIPGEGTTIFFEDVPSVARRSSEPPDHVPIFAF